MKDVTIREQDFFRMMTEEIEPMLAEVRSEGFFEAQDGLRIHYEMMLHPQARGSIVIAHGFTESAEKYREVAYRCYMRDWSVFVIDHRGHGRSDRHVMPEFLTHVEKFSDYVDDFERFLDQVVTPNSPGGPKLLFGHSMGGAVAGLILQRRPEYFDRAVLNAPMIQAGTGGIPMGFAIPLSRVLCALGMKKRVMFGYPTKYNPQEDFDTSCSTDSGRFNYYQGKRRRTPRLQNTSPSIGWVREALSVTAPLLDAKRQQAVVCPVLLLQGEKDHVVVAEAQRRYIAQLPAGRLVQIAGSKHEIFMSPDDVLTEYYCTMFDFCEEAFR